MHSKLRWIQVLSDAAIPLLGYFLWKWSLFFIVLYYLADLLISEVFMYVKSRSILTQQGGRMLNAIKYVVWSIVLHIGVFVLIRLFILQIHPKTSVWGEIEAFWRYEDLGVPQGYILFPLLFIGYQRYKNEFLLKELHHRLTIDVLWYNHIKLVLLLFSITSLLTASTYIMVFPDWIYLALLLLGTSIYQFKRA